jgi:GNAT superfamily N-acetyltransferase
MRITPLLITSRDKDGELLGGLGGKMFYDWLSIDLLWVHEAWRGKGHGTSLLLQAESEARARGCKRAWLDTIGEAAMPFYVKNGYGTWGALPDYPPGFTRIFLLKAL